jgi:hypothetical protein
VPEFVLTVRAAYPNGDLLAGRHRVTVLDYSTLARVGTGHMINGVATVQVPAGHYEVCLAPSGSQSIGTSLLAGWSCLDEQVQAGASVTFKLAPEGSS